MNSLRIWLAATRRYSVAERGPAQPQGLKAHHMGASVLATCNVPREQERAWNSAELLRDL